ncbi:MAG: TIGR03621 family F420-dependent LLM class oxidoreductase [Actinomycetia bacterium]|nr:TIGR03621 family F420-dependent LLM class oxidoreductase [Actinomycetes bacterium]
MSGRAPIRFGVAGTNYLDSLDAITELARRAEGTGFSSLTVNDHVFSPLAPLPVLTAAAVATTTLKLGTLVLANDFRQPVMLAKEAATIDALSGGRLELGIGAGWADVDYRTLGMAQAPAGVRIGRTREAIEICRGAWAGERFDFTGQHYRVRGLEGTPRPTHGTIPICIGGGGRRVLTLAAREADIVGINLSFASGQMGGAAATTGTEELTRERVAWVADAAADAGRTVELQCRVHTATVTDDPDPVIESAANSQDLTPAQVQASPHNLVGSTAEITDKIHRFADELGLTYWVIPHEAASDFVPVVEALAES